MANDRSRAGGAKFCFRYVYALRAFDREHDGKRLVVPLNISDRDGNWNLRKVFVEIGDIVSIAAAGRRYAPSFTLAERQPDEQRQNGNRSLQ